ncbi:MAG: hypothetical protein WBK77_01375 [Alphaproteobacteria bacterium]
MFDPINNDKDLYATLLSVASFLVISFGIAAWSMTIFFYACIWTVIFISVTTLVHNHLEDSGENFTIFDVFFFLFLNPLQQITCLLKPSMTPKATHNPFSSAIFFGVLAATIIVIIINIKVAPAFITKKSYHLENKVPPDFRIPTTNIISHK